MSGDLNRCGEKQKKKRCSFTFKKYKNSSSFLRGRRGGGGADTTGSRQSHMRDYNNKSSIVSNSILFKKKFLILNKQARCEMFRSGIHPLDIFSLRARRVVWLRFFFGSSYKVNCKLFSLSVEIVMQILMH